MHIPHLILQEIRYRKLNFALGVLSVIVAVGCAVGFLTLLERHDRSTQRILAEKERATAAMMKKLEDDYRKIALRMGFNMAILPKDQPLGEFYADLVSSRYMPEEYAQRLSQKKPATINHLAPVLQQKTLWPEQQRPILLTGVRGEVYIQGASQKPILEAIEPGRMVVGYELHRDLKLKVGQKVKLMGREFAVSSLQPGRGSKDDIAVLINLSEAQELLKKPGQINSILALECECSNERLAAIRKEVSGILPEVQIIEFAALAGARAESRNRAAEAAAAAVRQEKAHFERLRRERLAVGRVLVPVVLIGSVVWILVLMLSNVRDRGGEIGLLRSIGLNGRQILSLFLGKAVLMGLLGAGAGYVAGRVVGGLGQGMESVELPWIRGMWLMACLVGAPLLASVASWIPALLAALQDPAALLREE